MNLRGNISSSGKKVVAIVGVHHMYIIVGYGMYTTSLFTINTLTRTL